MGPTCEILLQTAEDATLDRIDAVLATLAEPVSRTRKGRVWDVWVQGRPVQVSVVAEPPAIELSAGGNTAEDWAILQRLADGLASALGGMASKPSK